jgi:hypothetical protein
MLIIETILFFLKSLSLESKPPNISQYITDKGFDFESYLWASKPYIEDVIADGKIPVDKYQEYVNWRLKYRLPEDKYRTYINRRLKEEGLIWKEEE